MSVDYSTQNVINTTTLPDWYTNAITPIVQNATAYSQQPYTLPPAPGVAALTPQQLQSFQGVQNAQGAVTPQLQQSFDYTNQAANVNSAAAGAPQFNQATGLFNNVAGANTSGISNPYVNQGTGYLNQAAQGSSLGVASPYIQQSTQPTGLAAASGYLQQAGQNFNSPGVAQSYMNPYNSAVTDRIAQLGQQNLTENILPSISDQFINSGQFGSPQMGTVTSRAIRDLNQTVLGQQAQALESGYTQGQNTFESDQARQAQLAGTAGGLGQAQQGIEQNAGTALGNLSSTDLSRLAAAGVNIGNLGIGQAGVAGSDLSRQLAAGQGIEGIGQANISAAQTDAARQLAAGQQMGSLAANAQNLNYQNIGALDASGQEQQNQTQQNYNYANQQQLAQQNYPWQQMGNASDILHGLQVPVTTSGQSQTSTPGPNVVSQVAGLGVGVAGLANAGVFKAASGGRVKKRTYSYGNTPKRGIAFAEAA